MKVGSIFSFFVFGNRKLFILLRNCDLDIPPCHQARDTTKPTQLNKTKHGPSKTPPS